MGATKRLNLDMSPEQEEELSWLRDALGASTTKDTVLRAIRVLGVLSREIRRGARVYLQTAEGETARLLLPELELPEPEWKWLVARHHPWRRQLWIKGRRVMASKVWRETLASRATEAEVAEDRDLPLEAVREAIAWSDANAELIAAEAREERRWLQERGVRLEPEAAR